jgi:hypothetical protein
MKARFYKGAGHGIKHELAEEINNTVIQIIEGIAE